MLAQILDIVTTAAHNELVAHVLALVAAAAAQGD